MHQQSCIALHAAGPCDDVPSRARWDLVALPELHRLRARLPSRVTLRPVTNGHDELPLNRLEALSDGVFAIAITLLVLELALEPGAIDDPLPAIFDEWPSYLAYVTSFLTIGVVWAAALGDHGGTAHGRRDALPAEPPGAPVRGLSAVSDEARGRVCPRARC